MNPNSGQPQYNQPQQPVQPQPPQQPFAPQQPMATAPPQPGYAPQQPMGYAQQSMAPQRPGGNGKLFAIIGGIVGLLVVIGIIIAVVMIFFGPPSKEDYRKSATTYDEAKSAYSEMSLDVYDLTSSSSTATSRKNTIDSMKENQTKFNDKFVELGKMKAITNDKDLKSKWEAVEAKRANFNSTLDQLYEIAEKVTPLLEEMSDMDSPTSAELASLKSKIDGVNVKDSATNDYLAALSKFIQASITYNNYLDGDDYDSSQYSAYSSASTAYYDATKDWSSSIEKTSESAEIKDELNSLVDAINEKIS